MSKPEKLICFDLEGPLSPQDNAYEVMATFPGGREIFEVISLYDDELTMVGALDYEPGDTLKLIVPYLVHNGVGSEAIKAVSAQAKIVDGAAELVEWLRGRGWAVRIISTSYAQHAHTIGARIGIEPQDIACTELPIDEMIARLSGRQTSFMDQQQREVLSFHPPLMGDSELKASLDTFFWDVLVMTDLGAAMQDIKVMGGARKMAAAAGFARDLGLDLTSVAAIGDSITDFKMLDGVKRNGGLAIAFNSNDYALPFAGVSLASTSLLDLKPVFEAWKEGGLAAVKAVSAGRNELDWIDEVSDMPGLVAKHKETRTAVRGEASKLG